jgi:CO/xanthine dehydrogenase FAD-binding subunit
MSEDVDLIDKLRTAAATCCTAKPSCDVPTALLLLEAAVVLERLLGLEKRAP